MGDQNKNVPRLRFPGYTDAWVERTFFDNIKNIIDFRGRTPKKLGMNWSDTGYLALSALNVKNGYIDPEADAHYGNQELYDTWMIGKELHKNQVLFTTEAPMGNVAQVPDNKKYILSQRVIAFDVKEDKIAEDFLATILRSPKTFNELSALSSGGTAKGVSQKILARMKIVVPNSLDEQIKIGSSLSLFDKIIDLHQEELLKLKNLKKSYLGKMFPKNGSDIPELRFPGYTDAWVKCKLGDVVKKIKSYSLSRDVETDKHTGYKYIHYGDIHTNVAGYIDEESILPNIKADDFDILDAGDLIVADASEDYQGIAKPAVLVVKPTSNVVAGLHTIALRPTHSNSIFVYYLLQTDLFKQFGKKAGTGMKVFGITFSNLSKFHTSFPTEDEQHKIGKFLHSIDDLITVNERELNKLKELKKSYLKNMFV